jgi:HK97 family phage portal protein
MSIFGGLFKSPFQQKDRSFNEIIQLLFSNQVSSGENVTPQNAMRCTTVHAIIRALTNSIGSFPVMVYQLQRDSDGKETLEPIPEHSVMKLLKVPNKSQTQTMYMRMCMTHVGLWGNHISIKGQGATGPIRFLRPVHPEQVRIDEDDPQNPIYKITFKKGQEREFPPREILHITGGINIEGLMATSPVALASEAIGLCLAAERLLAELYGNGAIPAFLLTGGKFTDKEQYQMWIDSFKQTYGAGGDRGGVAMLPEGMDAKELTFKPMDAQLLEARKFQRTEIASVWGVPPHKLADLERATFSNIEHQGVEFAQDVMLPYVRLFEQAMERDLLSIDDRRNGVVIRFDLDAAVRADFKARVEGYAKLHSVGAMSPNEIRAREGMNPRTDPEGDAYQNPQMGSNLDDDSNDATDDNGDEEGGTTDSGTTPAVSAVQ